MARIVIRCRYTGHYIWTDCDTSTAPIAGGRVFCPFCAADHVWACAEARTDDRPLVRQAG